MNNSPCCEKCLDYDTDSGKMCFNHACECHSNSQEKQKSDVTLHKLRFHGGKLEEVPSEAWEADWNVLTNADNCPNCVKQRAFIRTLIAEAREEAWEDWSKRSQPYEEGFKSGYEHGKEAGRTAALKKCLEVIEGKKIVSDSVDDTRADLVRGYNAALSDMKQEITSLLK